MDYSKMSADELKEAIDNANKKINKLNAKIVKMRNAGMTEEDFDDDLEQIEQLKSDISEMESVTPAATAAPTKSEEPEEPLAPAKPSTTAALKEAHDKFDTGVQKALNGQQDGTRIKGTHGRTIVQDANSKTGLKEIKGHTISDDDFDNAKNWIDDHQKQWAKHLTEKAYSEFGYDTPEKLAELLHDNPEEYKNVTKRVKDYVNSPDNQLSPKELLEAFYVRDPRVVMSVMRYGDYKKLSGDIDNAFKLWQENNPRLLKSTYKMAPETVALQDKLNKLRQYNDTDWDEKQSNLNIIKNAVSRAQLSDPYAARNVGLNAKDFLDKFDADPANAVKDYLNLENHAPKTGKGFEIAQDPDTNTPDPKQGISVTFRYDDVNKLAKDGFGLTTNIDMKDKDGNHIQRVKILPPAVTSKLMAALHKAYGVWPSVTAVFGKDSSNMKNINENISKAVSAFKSGDWSPLADKIFGKKNLGTKIYMGRDKDGNEQWYEPKVSSLNYGLKPQTVAEEIASREAAERGALDLNTDMMKAIQHYRNVFGDNNKSVPLQTQIDAVKLIAKNMQQQKNNMTHSTGDRIMYTFENEKVTEPVLREAETMINKWLNKNINNDIRKDTRKSNKGFMDQVSLLMKRVPEMVKAKNDLSGVDLQQLERNNDPDYYKYKKLSDWYNSHGGDAQLDALAKFVAQNGGSFADFQKKWASKNSTNDLSLRFHKYDKDGKNIGVVSADELFDKDGQPMFSSDFSYSPIIYDRPNESRKRNIQSAINSGEKVQLPSKQLGSFDLLDNAIASISDIAEKNDLKAAALQNKIDSIKELQPYYRQYSKALSELPDEQKGLEEAKAGVVLRETKFKELGGNKRIAELENEVMTETDPDKVDELNKELQNLYTARSNLSRAMSVLNKKNKDLDLDALNELKGSYDFDNAKTNALAYIDAGGDEGLEWLNKQLEDVLNGKETSDTLYRDYLQRKWKKEDRAARGINTANFIDMLNNTDLSDEDIANNDVLLRNAMDDTIPDSQFITDEDKMLRKNYKDYAKNGDTIKSYNDVHYDEEGNPVYENILYSVPDMSREELEDIKAQKRIDNKQVRKNVNANNRYKHFMQQIEKSFDDNQDIVKIGDSVCDKDLLKYIFPAGIKSVANLLSSKKIAHESFDEAEAINAIARRVKLVNALNDDSSLLSKLGISKLDELKRMMAYEEAQNMKPVDRKHYVDIIMGDKNEKD